MDQFECGKFKGVSYNQVYDIFYHEDSSPPAMPVTLEEFKLFAGIDIDEDDTLIENTLIPAGVMICERATNISFIPRTITAHLNNGNGGNYLPMGPVRNTPTAEDYEGNAVEAVFRNQEFVQVISPKSEYIAITYEAGYEILPADLKTAVLNQVRYLYDNRAEGKTDVSPIAKLTLDRVSRIW